MGFLMAILLPILSTALMFLIVEIFPTFAISGAFTFLAILAIALLWGTGPGLLATLFGAILFNLFILPPHFTWSWTTQHVIETGIFLAIGVAISLVTSLMVKVHAEATVARQEQLHELVLRETNARINEFLGVTSHELRTPLTTIKGNIQLARLRLQHLEREAFQNNLMVDLEEIYTMLSRAERQVNVQNRLIRDLTDISHIQDGKLELAMEPFNLTNIVVSTIEDLRSAYPHRAINLTLQTEGTIPITADSERISQVMSNYVTNALKYSPSDRPVTVSLELLREAARVTVCDEGPGLTPLEQEQVWERFSKIKSIKVQKGFSSGLGLGLHICRAIVEEHRGEVGVESIKGVGSTFWFSIPISNDPYGT
jgi:signal transduction histidine kinase